MNQSIRLFAIAVLFGVSAQAGAIRLADETPASSRVYAPTASAVAKAMDAMRYEYEIDEDGDLKYAMEGTGWMIYVIFDKLSTGELWNLQVVAQFGTKRSRYDELLAFANQWNAEKRVPKVYMLDADSMRVEYNYPIQYGFNPDEFEDNVIGLFETTLKQIADQTDDMRR